jgi:hypothetical protein
LWAVARDLHAAFVPFARGPEPDENPFDDGLTFDSGPVDGIRDALAAWRLWSAKRALVTFARVLRKHGWDVALRA